MIGVFFNVFTICTAFWFIFYIMSYSFTSNLVHLEYFIRISFLLSLWSLYGFLLFMFHFPKVSKNTLRHAKIFGIFFFLLWCIYLSTPLIIDGLYFENIQNDWYENPWDLYMIHVILSFLFLPLFCWASYRSFVRLKNLDYKRFQFIFGGMFIFILLTFLSLLILPEFWIFTLERYVWFFFLPFIAGVFYSMRRYEFLDTKIIFTKILSVICCFLCSYFVVKVWSSYSHNFFSESYQQYWRFSIESSFISVFLWVSTFCILYSMIQKYIIPHIHSDNRRVFYDKIQLQIPFLTGIHQLNDFLKANFRSHMGIEWVQLDTDMEKVSQELKDFFSKNILWDYAVNDYVFLEENKLRLSHKAFLEEEWYLYFPIRKADNALWAIFKVWYKRLNDPFLSEEISLLKSFTEFLSGHLTYLWVYQKMQELSIDLDKKVDEKTIEYNNLISKQKEFIRYVGHEIKNPITNAIFLSDDIRDESQRSQSRKIKEDTEILHQELLKISQLVKTIFDTEKFDLQKVRLYKRDIDIWSLLEQEVSLFRSRYNAVKFHTDIQEQKYFWEIDEVQFRQVITNILVNALKFSDHSQGEVHIKIEEHRDTEQNEKIKISIEDNGKWFSSSDLHTIFEKYSTWTGTTSGLWMGLYLCKKIVELHGGRIYAWRGDTLSWAKFVIII